MKTLTEKRVDWIDTAKGLGMIMVILLHVQALLPFRVLCGAFHMPLFFFLAGFFVFAKPTDTFDFVKKKAKSLLVPYLIFGFVLATYSTVIDLFIGRDITPGFRHIGLLVNARQAPFFGSLWFLLVLFLGEVTLYFIHRNFHYQYARITLCVLAYCTGVFWLGTGKVSYGVLI